MAWLRLDEHLPDNVKAQSLKPELFKFWVNLLCICRQHRGTVPDVQDISWRLRLPRLRVERNLMELMHTGLIDSNPDGLLVHQWHDWQYTSDLSTDRVKRFRKRHETVSCNAPEQNRTEQNRTEQIQNRAESPLPPLTEGTDAWAESVYARWKKRGDKVLAMQALSQVSMVRDSFEKQYAFWFAYYEAIGWQFAPKLANFLHDQSYLYDPPALTPKAETTEEMLARHDRENGET